MWRHQNAVLRSFFFLEAGLRSQNEASESLITMFCDAICWLEKDTATVTSCDHRFNMLMGRDMVGEKFSHCLAQDSDERERLQGAFSRVPENGEDAPATLLPTTLVCEGGTSLNVDLYIVGRHG